MTRFSSLLSVVALLVSLDAAAQRHRAVRSPAPQCSFSLSLTLSFATSISAEGLESGTIHVIGSPSTCTSWNAYSLTEWVTVERFGNSVLVDVAPNPLNVPRVADVLIAGIRYQFTQDGSPLISPPVDNNVLRNGGFNTDLSFWGWRDEFPNGQGSAQWSSSDANGNPNSGSILMRNIRVAGMPGHTFQRLQCVDVEGGEIYLFGGKFFATSTSGNAIFVVVEYTGPDCNSGAITPSPVATKITTPNVWLSESRTQRLHFDTKSAFMIIGSISSVPGTFELLIDDVFLRKR